MLTFAQLTNKNQMSVVLSNWGARITSIRFRCDDDSKEMLATYAKPDSFLIDPYYMGATCGPVCNRIEGANFKINHTTYLLSKNDGENCLHGGSNNISSQYWNVITQSDSKVTYELGLTHLQEGFPGNRIISVEYELDDDNKLSIKLIAETDMDTPINLTNHAYFNLGEKDILALKFRLSADKFLEKDSHEIPTGAYIKASNTGLDISQWQSVKGFLQNNQYAQIKQNMCVDHCFVLKDHTDKEPKAGLVSESNQVRLDIFSDQPAMHFYSGEHLSAPFKANQGLCFESQGFTDAVNHPLFPSVLLKKGSTYCHKLAYQFTSLSSELATDAALRRTMGF